MLQDPKLAEALPVLAAETMNRLANNDATLLSIPALDFVSMMQVGRDFGFYADMGVCAPLSCSSLFHCAG